MPQVIYNNRITKTSSAITNVATTIPVQSAAGFPDPGTDYYFATLAYVEPSSGKETDWEIVKVTSVTANDITVERAQEGTTARAWDAFTPFEVRITAGTLTMPDATQTVTNKTIQSSTIDGTPIGGSTASTASFTDLTATGTVSLPATNVTIGNVDSTEISYLNGVSSAIQTQIDTKYEAGDSPTFADIIADTLQFTGGTGTQGTLSWNADEETVDLIQDGAVLQLGQEVHYHVRNGTGQTIANGTPVMATGTLGASGRIVVAPMDGTDFNNEKFYLGVATEDITAGTDGKVTYFGKVRGVNLSAYTDGDVLWLSTDNAGEFTIVEPDVGIKLAVAYVIHAAVNGTMFVRFSTSVGLHDLHDVWVNAVGDKEILQYDGVNERWENKTLSEAGIAPSNISLDGVTDNGNSTTNGITVGSATITGDLTVDTNTFVVDSTNNYVGIGTSSPAKDLDVDGEFRVRNKFADYLNISSTGVLTGSSDSWTMTGSSTTTNPTFTVSSIHSTNKAPKVVVDGLSEGTLGNSSGAAGGTYVSDSQGGAILLGRDNSISMYRAGGSPVVPDFKLDASGNTAITGDLTVDTDTLHVDSTNNWVGIGTNNPSATLDVNGKFTVNGASSGAIEFDINGRLRSSLGGSFLLDSTKQGDATLPTYTFRGDGDTGWWWPGANTMAWSTGGTERMRIDSSGNVGIGNTNPAYSLHVGDGTDGFESLVLQSSSTGRSQIFMGDSANVDAMRITYWNNGDYLTFGHDAAIEMMLDSSGNVGIGTSSPNWITSGTQSNQGVLSLGTADTTVVTGDVIGALSFVTADPSYTSTYADGVGAQISAVAETGVGGAYGLSFTTGTTTATNRVERMRIDSSGNVGIGTTNPIYPLQIGDGNDSLEVLSLRTTSAGVGYIFFGDPANVDAFRLGYSNSSDTFTMGHDTNIEVAVDSSGNVGIGTSNPTEALTVNGVGYFFNAAAEVRLAPDNAIGLDFGAAYSAIPAAQNHGYVATASSSAGGANGDLLIAPRTSAAASVRFITGTTPTERMRIDASGNVGIGTSSPVTALHVNDGVNVNAGLRASETLAGGAALVGFNDTGSLTIPIEIRGTEVSLRGGSAEGLRVTTSGNVGIGTSAPNAKLQVSPSSSSGDQGEVAIYLGNENTSGRTAAFIKNTTAPRELTIRASNSAADPEPIIFEIDSSTEAMRIDDSGGLTVGNSTQIAFNENTDTGTTIIGNGALTTFRDSASANLYVGKIGALDGDVLEFRRNGLDVGSISVISGATSYNTSSDVRLKENIQDADSSGSVIDAIKVRQYDWKADGTHDDYGFVAQELYEVYPKAVSKGETEEDTWGVDYSKLVPLLVKEIQELKAELAALKGA